MYRSRLMVVLALLSQASGTTQAGVIPSRRYRILHEKLRRFAVGDALLNVVDPEKAY